MVVVTLIASDLPLLANHRASALDTCPDVRDIIIGREDRLIGAIAVTDHLSSSAVVTTSLIARKSSVERYSLLEHKGVRALLRGLDELGRAISPLSNPYLVTSGRGIDHSLQIARGIAPGATITATSRRDVANGRLLGRRARLGITISDAVDHRLPAWRVGSVEESYRQAAVRSSGGDSKAGIGRSPLDCHNRVYILGPVVVVLAIFVGTIP